MTCIVGIVKNGKVYIGGDSAGANSALQIVARKDRKVFRNGDFLIGGTTSFRMLQLLCYAFQPPKCEDEDIARYMATKFVDAVRDCFKAGGFATKYSEQEHGGQFLVGYKGRLFLIYSDYQIEESLDDYNACGCGTDIALGALYATPRMAVTKRLIGALEAAQQHSAGVRGPFYFDVLE